MCGFAAVMMMSGAGLYLVEPGDGPDEPVETANMRPVKGSPQPGMGNAFLPGDLPNTTPDPFPPSPAPGPEDKTMSADAGDDSWGPPLMRGGTGFLIGFAIGYAFRTLLKMTLAVFGFIMLAVVFFNYMGWVDINWETIQTSMGQWGGTIKEEFANFQTFLQGIIPTASLGGLGLFSGFRRK